MTEQTHPYRSRIEWEKMYPFPEHLVRKTEEKVFPKGPASQPEFFLEDYVTCRDVLGEIYATNPEQAKVFFEARAEKVEQLRTKIVELKKDHPFVYGNINAVAMSFPDWVRHAFFEKYPQTYPAKGVINERHPTHACPRHPIVEELVAAQFREILTLIPELDAVAFTSGDNGGYLWCERNKHELPEDYTEQWYCQVANAAWRGLSEASSDALFIAREWGHGGFLHEADESFLKENFPFEKPNFLIGTKYCTPYSEDITWNFGRMSPIIDKDINVWVHVGWGENSNDLACYPCSVFPHFIPDRIQETFQRLKSAPAQVPGFIHHHPADRRFSLLTELDNLVFESCAYDPDFDLDALVNDWAVERFGKAAPKVLEALEHSRELLAKFTWEPEGMNSLHLIDWEDKGDYGSPKHIPDALKDAAHIETNLDALLVEWDARPAGLAMLEKLNEAMVIEPENELIDLYRAMTEAYNIPLSRFWTNYHQAFLHYQCFVAGLHAEQHRKKALDMVLATLREIEDYRRTNFLYHWEITWPRIFATLLEERLTYYITLLEGVVATASSQDGNGNGPDQVLRSGLDKVWRPSLDDTARELSVDLGKCREVGAVEVSILGQKEDSKVVARVGEGDLVELTRQPYTCHYDWPKGMPIPSGETVRIQLQDTMVNTGISSLHLAGEGWSLGDTRGGFIVEWNAIGPFPDQDGQGIHKSYIDEQLYSLPETAPHPDANRLKFPNSLIDFLQVGFSETKNLVVYMQVYLEVEEDQEAMLFVGSDDGCKAFVNGEEVIYSGSMVRPCDADSDNAVIQLKKGRNSLLVKVQQFGGGWQMATRIVPHPKVTLH